VSPRRADCASTYQAGFSLVELMIAITLGMLVMAGLTVVYVNSSRTHAELEKASQQIENGRYAMQVLGDELRLAGYLAEFNIAQAGLATPLAKPDPCASDIASLSAALPLHIQGYDNSATLTCISDQKANTDVLVVRRVSTCVSGAAGCTDVAGAAYFQASLCNNSTELGSASATDQFRFDTAAANLNRHKKDCITLASTRRYITNIYFVANNDLAGDGMPTLKRAELGAGGFTIVSLANGIENLQLEYGIDTNNDGVPDALNAGPDTYGACVGVACVTNWVNVMLVSVNVLARNTSTSPAYTDTKTYSLGLNANGSANTVGPFNDGYRRHVFQAQVRLNNPAGRRE
jgi:type IV pilus assembly protein PilW